MAVEQRVIYVFDSFSGKEPAFMGRLYAGYIRGAENYAFEYDNEWLHEIKMSIMLDPELMPYPGRQYPSGKKTFGIFADASPDRWGRVLMNRKERMLADIESRKPRKLYDCDYLLGVYDGTRMGGLRFKTEPEGPFLDNDEKNAVPPWERLRSLEEASRRFENDDYDDVGEWLRLLIQPGSSLGGTRPKASVSDERGDLWIAKFPSKNDENNTGAWEKVTHDLAEMCGLVVPEAKLERFSDYGSTFLVKRFDRDGTKRIHYASALTLLGKTDGASAADGTSYLDIASFIKASGANPKADLAELWKRIVFSMAVTNTDDHLRNHAFLLTNQGWKLSPMYDVNPVPYGDELALNVNATDNRINVELAIEVAERFGITKGEARSIGAEIINTVGSNWEKLAEQAGITHRQIEAMRPAFGLKKPV